MHIYDIYTVTFFGYELHHPDKNTGKLFVSRQIIIKEI